MLLTCSYDVLCYCLCGNFFLFFDNIFIIYLFIYLSLNIFLLLFNYSCLHFLPTPPTHPSQTHLLPLPPPSPLVLSMCPLYVVLEDPYLIFRHYPSPLSPLVTISLFFISISLLVFYLLVCFGD